MKANELVVGKKYWCGWASRSAWFVRFETHTWCGKTEKIAVFRDVCDCYIECNVEQVERWVSERQEVLAMYEQSLLCGIMNDWYGSMEDLFQDLKHYGFEVLESNRESITVSCNDDGDYVQIELVLGGTERTIVVEDFEEIYREEAQASGIKPPMAGTKPCRNKREG